MEWYLAAFKKYAVFTGRARRKEYWYFKLLAFIFLLLIVIACALFGRASYTSSPLPILTTLNLGCLVYILAQVMPGLSVAVRRLHDTDHSAWWLFIGIIPIVGPIVILILMVTDGTPGENQYGPNPKGVLVIDRL